MAATTSAPHVWLDERKRAWIDDTNVKVVEVALDHLAYGWSAEEMHSHHPHLSLAQIYAALAYYHDHQAEFDRQIEESRRQADDLAAKSADSPVRRRLRAAGKLSASRSTWMSMCPRPSRVPSSLATSMCSLLKPMERYEWKIPSCSIVRVNLTGCCSLAMKIFSPKQQRANIAAKRSLG